MEMGIKRGQSGRKDNGDNRKNRKGGTCRGPEKVVAKRFLTETRQANRTGFFGGLGEDEPIYSKLNIPI